MSVYIAGKLVLMWCILATFDPAHDTLPGKAVITEGSVFTAWNGCGAAVRPESASALVTALLTDMSTWDVLWFRFAWEPSPGVAAQAWDVGADALVLICAEGNRSAASRRFDLRLLPIKALRGVQGTDPQSLPWVITRRILPVDWQDERRVVLDGSLSENAF